MQATHVIFSMWPDLDSPSTEPPIRNTAYSTNCWGNLINMKETMKVPARTNADDSHILNLCKRFWPIETVMRRLTVTASDGNW